MKNFKLLFDVFCLHKNSKILLLAVLVAGCSTMPDALNPVEWYKGARDVITGNVGTTAAEDEEVRGTKDVDPKNDGFAKLSSVPPRPTILSKEDRKKITTGLVADHDASRKYSSGVIKRENKMISSNSNTGIKVDNKIPQKSEQKLSESNLQIKEKRLIKPQPLAAGSYVVPPKPVDLSSLQNKTKIKTEKNNRRVLPKPTLKVSPKLKKFSSINPNPPRIGVVPGMDLAIDQSQTIVISGSGVERIETNNNIIKRDFKLPPSRLSPSGINISESIKKNNRQNASYQIATILFKNGSAKVGARDRRVLRKVVAQHRKLGGRLRVIGHASRRTATNDPILHKMTNFQVSAARAERVAKELVKMGIRSDKLFVSSVSDREPRYYEYMPSGEAGNRRAEIFIDFL